MLKAGRNALPKQGAASAKFQKSRAVRLKKEL